jgi:ectoine hydroxylase-related dioxygenase (phytanoyl-CoA dioxygenase family)
MYDTASLAEKPHSNDLPGTLDMAEIQRKLEEDGYAIVPDVIGPEELASVREALDRAAAEDEAAGNPQRYGPEKSNWRVWALLNRGEEFIRLGMNPVALRIVRDLLGYEEILLSSISANVTGPGGDREIGRLHTDQNFLPEGFAYKAVSNVTFFLDDFTEENGGTIYVPGSHRLRERPDFSVLAPSAPAQFVGKAGSIAVWDGRLHHGTGLNRTKDQQRRGIIATFFAPYLRSQENWFETLDRRLLDKFPGLAELIGFKEWSLLGSVNGPKITSLNF